MSWSAAFTGPKTEANKVLRERVEDTWAFKNEEYARPQMITALGAVQAELHGKPDDCFVGVELSGHANRDGLGTVTIKVQSFLNRRVR
jgi:hypothetical protein